MRPHPRRALTDPSAPSAWATCGRCGFVTNLINLQWQFDFRGLQLQNLQILVCEDCLDLPQRQLGTIIIPPDPVGVKNARPEQYAIDEIWPRLTQGGQPRYLQGSECSRSLQASYKPTSPHPVPPLPPSPPFSPSLDFSDPRNSQYIPLLP